MRRRTTQQNDQARLDELDLASQVGRASHHLDGLQGFGCWVGGT
jgi:hypothetical protein